MKTKLLRCIACILAAVIIFSGFQLWNINRNYAQEAAMHNHVLQFRPQISFIPPSYEEYAPQYTSSTQPDNPVVNNDLIHRDGPVYSDNAAQHDNAALQIATPPASDSPLNQSIVDLQTAYRSTIGWLTIPNTLIDYPFVQGTDNEFYLHMDLEHNRSLAGTVFMDYRNSNDFSDFNTIIFGHNMKNGSMFGTLQHFSNPEFFHNNRVSFIVLDNKTFAIELFAFAVINPNDSIIYDPNITDEADKTVFLDYVQSIARHYRDIEVTSNDQIITLSTCSYEFDNARMVLMGRLIKI